MHEYKRILYQPKKYFDTHIKDQILLYKICGNGLISTIETTLLTWK